MPSGESGEWPLENWVRGGVSADDGQVWVLSFPWESQLLLGSWV